MEAVGKGGASGRARLQWAVALGGVLLVAAGVSLQKIRSFDYWWHLRTGGWIAEHGSVPRVDPYTYTVTGEPWLDVHWLHQLGLHAVHSLSGHEGVVIAKLVLVLAWLALLAPIGARRERPLVSGFALVLLLIAASERIMPRPELPTLVLLAAVLFVLDRSRAKPAWLAALVPIQWVWANLHGLYAVGLGVVALHVVGEGLDRVRKGGPRGGLPLLGLAAVLVAGALVTLANPAGLELLLYPVKQLGMIAPGDAGSSLGDFSVELQSLLTAWRNHAPLPLVCLALLAVGSLAAMAADWRRLRAADVLVWLALLGLAVVAVRNVPLFACVAAISFVRHANGWLDTQPARPRLRAVAAGLGAVAVVFLAADVARGSFAWRMGPAREAGLGIVEPLYPIGAAEWIARSGPRGAIFHHMADGGYLIWSLHPDVPVMWDGRLEVFGADRLARFRGDDVATFERLDLEYRFGTVLLHYAQFDQLQLMAHLHRGREFRLVFADDVAAVFVRLPGGRRFPPVDVSAPDLFEELPDARSPSGLMRRIARARFYAALGVQAHAQRARSDLERHYPNWRSGRP